LQNAVVTHGDYLSRQQSAKMAELVTLRPLSECTRFRQIRI